MNKANFNLNCLEVFKDIASWARIKTRILVVSQSGQVPESE